MATYYVNRQKQQNGDHEVHTQTCRFCHFRPTVTRWVNMPAAEAQS